MEEEIKKSRGGKREGAGRKSLGKRYTITVRITPEAFEIYNQIENKSEYIDSLIKVYGK